MDRHYENKFAYFRIDNQIVFLDIKEDVVLDLNAAVIITSDRMRFQEDKSFPVLFNINGLSDTDKAGRDYLAHYGWFLTKRVGILASPFKALMIAKFYLNLSRPKVASAIFDDVQVALDFLNCRTK